MLSSLMIARTRKLALPYKVKHVKQEACVIQPGARLFSEHALVFCASRRSKGFSDGKGSFEYRYALLFPHRCGARRRQRQRRPATARTASGTATRRRRRAA